jgi:hypothetical protein
VSLKTPLACLASGFAGIALVLACSDDAPPAADAAAVCDCPAAEPPLADRIVTIVGDAVDVPAGDDAQPALSCPEGAKLLSGGCDIGGLASPPNSRLYYSAKGSETAEGWGCAAANPGADTESLRVTITCLMPAE